MAKLKANTRFLNVFDSNIYEKGDVFTSENQSDIDYLTKHKIASVEKEAEDKKEAKAKK